MQKTREKRIRDRAVALWEAEGPPEGKDAEHWDRAEPDIGDVPIDGPAGGAGSVDEPAPDERADPLENPDSETLATRVDRGREAAESTPDSLPRDRVTASD